MPKAPFSDVLQYLRKVCAVQEARDLSDRQLLKRFLVQHEDAAFTVLVQRHGPMVFGVCQRVLADVHHAEDCLQATFMVLVRRAPSLRLKASLATWLYAVAQRVAHRSRAQSLARHQRERRVEPMPCREPLDELTWQELRAVLDEEIARLPEKYQAPLVLCYLQGKSQEQAAKELGWPKNSLTRRIGRARELLRQRLVRRGMALSAGVLTTALCEKVSGAPVGAMLTINTVKAAASVVAGKAVAAGCLSAPAIALAEEAVVGIAGIKGMAIVVVMALGLAVGGAGLAGYGALTQKDMPAKTEASQIPPSKVDNLERANQAASTLTDIYGDALPAGATARLGTVRWRPGGATSVSFAPDGKTLASGGTITSGVCLWDVATGRPVWRVGINWPVHFVAFSADGKLLFNSGNPGLFDAATGKFIRTVNSLTEALRFGRGSNGTRAFGAGEKLIALAGSKISLKDAETGTEFVLQNDDEEEVNKVAISRDNKLLAGAGVSGMIRLWEIKTGKEIRRWQANAGTLYSLDLSPDGKLLATVGASINTSIRIWETATGKEVNPSTDHAASVDSLAFSPDGKTLFSCGADQCVREWDLTTKRTSGRLFAGSFGSSFSGYGIPANGLSPDGTLFAQLTSRVDKRVNEAIRLCDTITGKELRRFGDLDLVRRFKFSPDGKLLAVGAAGGSRVQDGLGGLRLFDATTGKEVKHFEPRNLDVIEVCFSPNGKLLASREIDAANPFEGAIRLWDVGTGKEMLQWHTDWPGDEPVFSPDGKTLAFSDRGWNYVDKKVRICATDTGKEILDLGQGSGIASAEHLAYSPSGRILAISQRNAPAPEAEGAQVTCTIQLRDAQTGQQIRQINVPPQSHVTSLAFAPDGRTLASGGADSTILLWDLTGQPADAKSKPAALGAEDLHVLWADLAGHPAKADRAIWSLALAPRQSVAYLQDQFRIAPVTATQIAKLVAELDSEQYAVRQQAAKTLEELGAAAEAMLRKIPADNLTLESRQRIAQILAKRDKETIRSLRAIETLEHIGTPQARQVLDGLVKESPNPRVLEAAEAALRRLQK